MTEKQKKFADEYLIDLNGTRAYKAAYPRIKSDNAAAAAATRLLRNVKVKEYLGMSLEEAKSAKTAEASEVMEYLTAVMRGEDKAERPAVDALGEPTVLTYRDQQNRIRAAELLGKRFGLFAENVKVSGSMGVTIVDDIK